MKRLTPKHSVEINSKTIAFIIIIFAVFFSIVIMFNPYITLKKDRELVLNDIYWVIYNDILTDYKKEIDTCLYFKPIRYFFIDTAQINTSLYNKLRSIYPNITDLSNSIVDEKKGDTYTHKNNGIIGLKIKIEDTSFENPTIASAFVTIYYHGLDSVELLYELELINDNWTIKNIILFSIS